MQNKTIIKSPPSKKSCLHIIFNSKRKQSKEHPKSNPSKKETLTSSSQEQHKILNSKSSSIKNTFSFKDLSLRTNNSKKSNKTNITSSSSRRRRRKEAIFIEANTRKKLNLLRAAEEEELNL